MPLMSRQDTKAVQSIFGSTLLAIGVSGAVTEALNLPYWVVGLMGLIWIVVATK